VNIIFDFDGTIADSFDYVLGFLCREAGRDVPKGKEAESYRRKPMKEIALELGIPFWRLPGIYFKGRRIMRANMEHVHTFDGIPEIIRQLHKEGNTLYIISSNSSKNIKHFLRQYELKDCFKAVWGGAGIFGKVLLIKQLRRRYRIKGDIWYVGDELTDIVSAKAAGAKTVAVSWGFAERESILKIEPTYLIDAPKELLQIKL
jgi:phosphoglycolate phosphatase